LAQGATLVSAIQTVAGSVVTGLLSVAARFGGDPDALLAQADIAAGVIADRDARVPMGRYRALFGLAKQATRQPALALHYGETVNLSEVSVVGLIGHASETMAEAFAQLNRYGRLVVEVDTGDAERFGHEIDSSGLWLVDRRRDVEPFPELTELTFARMVCGVRGFAPSLNVHEVHVTHQDPGYAHDYERVFRCPVRFGQARNAYRMDEAWLTHRIGVQPRYTFGILANHADALLAKLDAKCTTRGRVEAALLPVLHEGNTSIDRIASKLGMSRATLSRRLKAEGTTFVALLDALRERMALDYLSARRASVSETAYLVGFSDPAAFSRAFKRWTGNSPKDVRGGGG
jgi:AraC-like DNA-binding protein